MDERRKQRSSDTARAAEYLMTAISERHEVQAMVLSEVDGAMVSGCERGGSDGKGEIVPISESYGRQLAAMAPQVIEDATHGEEAAWLGKDGAPIWAREVDVDGRGFLLIAVGIKPTSTGATEDAEPGIRRIMREKLGKGDENDEEG